jgi:hypothetical protein
MMRAISIALKIPDNSAYTALTALRRLGLDIGRVERADVWLFDDMGKEDSLAERVSRNETIFNPNKHELHVLGTFEFRQAHPQPGEAWIRDLEPQFVPLRIDGVQQGLHIVSWRLFSHGHEPADRQTVQSAVEQLLRNPAIEEALY